jgi:hypothetical protein
VIFGGEIGGEKGILRLKWPKSLPLRLNLESLQPVGIQFVIRPYNI